MHFLSNYTMKPVLAQGFVSFAVNDLVLCCGFINQFPKVQYAASAPLITCY